MSPRVYLSTALVLLALASPGPARAQKPAKGGGASEQIHALNQEAVAAMEAYSFKKARARLEQALGLAQGPEAAKDPAVAEAYALLGVAHISGSNDLYRGLHYFVRALRINPKLTIPKRLTTPQLDGMFKTARQTAKHLGAPTTIALEEEAAEKAPPSPSELPAGARGLVHSPIDTAKRGYPIPVKASAGADIQAHRVALLYRGAGTVQFTRLPMKKERGVFRASIPAEATQGRYIHYYIEALDQRGRLAATMGSARSPNVVIIN